MAIEDTLAERGGNYGSFKLNAECTQSFKSIIEQYDKGLTAQQREALEMICFKMSRIITGNNPEYEDNWVDIQGYARLGYKDHS